MTGPKLSLMCCQKAQPDDDDDDLIEAVAPPPRRRSPGLEPPQLRQRPVGQRVYREEPEFEPQRRVLRFQYVDDIVEVTTGSGRAWCICGLLSAIARSRSSS